MRLVSVSLSNKIGYFRNKNHIVYVAELCLSRYKAYVMVSDGVRNTQSAYITILVGEVLVPHILSPKVGTLVIANETVSFQVQLRYCTPPHVCHVQPECVPSGPLRD